MIATHLPPSTVIREIKRMLEAEIVAQPGDAITVKRGQLVLVFSSLANTAGEVEVLEESAAVADRLQEELRIVLADRERWRLASMAYQAAWSREVGRTSSPEARPPVFIGVDLARTPDVTVEHALQPWNPAGKGHLERAHHQNGNVIDITEELARERRDAGRPIGPEGGAA